MKIKHYAGVGRPAPGLLRELNPVLITVPLRTLSICDKESSCPRRASSPPSACRHSVVQSRSGSLASPNPPSAEFGSPPLPLPLRRRPRDRARQIQRVDHRPEVIAQHRSRQFSSSRTLPGQSYASSAFIASSLNSWVRPEVCARPFKHVRANSGMSCRRSRNGGIRQANTFKRKYRSRRNEPCATAVSRSRFVAARIRTLMAICLVLPTGRISFS